MKIAGSVIFIVSVLWVCLGQAAAKPDLSGVWRLDGSRSKVDPNVAEITKDYVVTIVQKESEIRMTTSYQKDGRNVIEKSTYYTDGRNEIDLRTGRKDDESTTRWRGNKLVRRITSKILGNVQTYPRFEAITIEEWELSADGKTLTLNLTFGGIRMGKFRYVFNRTS
jgi:hypothetical protein